MTPEQLIQTLAATLEHVAGRCLARLVSPGGYDVPSLRGTLAVVKQMSEEAAGLADADRPDPGEADLAALEAVRLDWETAAGTGTEPTISALTWEKVRAALRQRGQQVED